MRMVVSSDAEAINRGFVGHVARSLISWLSLSKIQPTGTVQAYTSMANKNLRIVASSVSADYSLLIGRDGLPSPTCLL